MKPRERAEAIPLTYFALHDTWIDAIEQAIIAAVEEEREACAKIAAQYEQEKREKSQELQDRNTPAQAAHMSTAIACAAIKNKIRARGEEAQKGKQ